MKTSVKIAIGVALFVAAERLYSFMERNSPVANEGKCLLIETGGFPSYVRARVIKNDYVQQRSLLSLNLKDDNIVGVWAKWAELRDMGIVGVPCK